jgi:RND family efflux transporter MFP subunit
MTYSRRPAFAWTAGALACGLFLLTPGAAGQDDPPRKPAAPTRPQTELERFRALEPAERLKLVEQLAGPKALFATAKRGDLAAAVVERGTIDAADYTDVYCKVRGRKDGFAAAINWLVDEGSAVKKGELIARLDDSALRDQLAEAALSAKAAGDALEKAAEDVRLVGREGEVEVRLAEIEVRLAEIDLKDAPPGKPKEGLELKVERSKLLLERERSRAKRQLVRAEAEKRAREAATEEENRRLADVREQLRNCALVAPADGLVIYHNPPAGRFGRAALVAPGEPVKEGQKLLRVTPLKQFVIATLVPESQVALVRAGQAARVRVDALPGKDLRGKVTRVSAVASQVDWWAREVKVYPVTVAIDDPPQALRPDMTGDVEVPVGERKGVLQVPRKAVVSVGPERVCFVRTARGLEERAVVVGLGSAESVEIREGLNEGDEVLAELVLPQRSGMKKKQPPAPG